MSKYDSAQTSISFDPQRRAGWIWSTACIALMIGAAVENENPLRFLMGGAQLGSDMILALKGSRGTAPQATLTLIGAASCTAIGFQHLSEAVTFGNPVKAIGATAEMVGGACIFLGYGGRAVQHLLQKDLRPFSNPTMQSGSFIGLLSGVVRGDTGQTLFGAGRIIGNYFANKSTGGITLPAPQIVR